MAWGMSSGGPQQGTKELSGPRNAGLHWHLCMRLGPADYLSASSAERSTEGPLEAEAGTWKRELLSHAVRAATVLGERSLILPHSSLGSSLPQTGRSRRLPA